MLTEPHILLVMYSCDSPEIVLDFLTFPALHCSVGSWLSCILIKSNSRRKFNLIMEHGALYKLKILARAPICL